jgi:hypothetical protein
MFIMWLPPTPVSSEGLFQNGLPLVDGGVRAPTQIGVEDAKPDANAEKLPVALEMVSASALPLSANTAAEATKIGFICGPPTFHIRQR